MVYVSVKETNEEPQKQRRWWVRFISMWTGKERINSFDTQKEAEWFADQVDGKILDWK